MKMSSIALALLATLVLITHGGKAQEIPGRTVPQWFASLKLMVHLNGAKQSGTSHFTLGASVGTALRIENFRPPAMLLQTGVNLYGNGLGTNLIDNYDDPGLPPGLRERRRKFTLDWVSSVIANVEWGPQYREEDRFLFPFVIFNQMTAYSVTPLYHNNIFYGTHFVLNSQHRNQQIGVAGINLPNLALTYYNDGVIGALVSDEYDRLWTGGGHLRFGLYGWIRDQSTVPWDHISIEYHYDRFTYDVQNGYKLSDILLIPNASNQDLYRLMYNNGMTTFKLNFGGYAVGTSITGRHNWDIQDLIHKTKGYPIHLGYGHKQRLFTAGWRPVVIPPRGDLFIR
jgi:hypothetical protein